MDAQELINIVFICETRMDGVFRLGQYCRKYVRIMCQLKNIIDKGAFSSELLRFHSVAHTAEIINLENEI